MSIKLRKKVITYEDKMIIVEEYRKGTKIKDITDMFDITRQTVHKVIKAYNNGTLKRDTQRKIKKKSGGTEAEEYKNFTLSETPKEDNVTDLTQKFITLHRKVQK